MGFDAVTRPSGHVFGPHPLEFWWAFDTRLPAATPRRANQGQGYPWEAIPICDMVASPLTATTGGMGFSGWASTNLAHPVCLACRILSSISTPGHLSTSCQGRRGALPPFSPPSHVCVCTATRGTQQRDPVQGRRTMQGRTDESHHRPFPFPPPSFARQPASVWDPFPCGGHGTTTVDPAWAADGAVLPL